MYISEFKEKTDFFEVKIAKGLRNYVNRRTEGFSKTFYEKSGDKKLEIIEERDLRGPFSFLFPERDKVEDFLKTWPEITAVFRIISRNIRILSPLGEEVERDDYLETFKVSLKNEKHYIESSDFSFEPHKIDFEKVKKEFSEYKKASEESIKPENGKYPVVFRAQAAGLLVHEFFGHLLEADISSETKSPFVKENIGKKIINDNISIEDLSEKPDDEGFFENRVVLIEKGVLKNFISDFSFHLKRFGKPGRGRRESFRTLPLPRQNLIFLKSEKTVSENELLKKIKRGFLVEKIRSGIMNYKTFDYEFTVTAAYFIEDGEISAFTDNFLIKGNFLSDFLNLSEFSSSVFCNGFEGVCKKQGQMVRIGYKTPSFLLGNLKIRSII